jgi:hypothetical protein
MLKLIKYLTLFLALAIPFSAKAQEFPRLYPNQVSYVGSGYSLGNLNLSAFNILNVTSFAFTIGTKLLSSADGKLAVIPAAGAAGGGWCLSKHASYANVSTLYGPNCSTAGYLIVGQFDVQADPGSGNAYFFHAGGTSSATNSIVMSSPSAVASFVLSGYNTYTCSAGAGKCAFNLGASQKITAAVQFTCSDTDGCDLHIYKTYASATQYFVFYNTSANAVAIASESGTGYCSKVSGGGPISLGQYDTVSFIYDGVNACWIQLAPVVDNF